MDKHKILIIEDDSTLLRGLKDNFSAHGFDVYTAMEGEQGLAIALEINPAIILLDIMLPKMDGYEVCMRIREAEFDMPIIMLTAKGQEEDIVRGLNRGADDYVTKPFGIKELIARVNAFIRRYQKKVAQDFQFGSYILNYHSRELTHLDTGTLISLTPKEYGVLELFTHRIGHALTRDCILNTVWKSNVLTTRRSVDRCINTLRAKIEVNPKSPVFIKSIRDVGYRFDV